MLKITKNARVLHTEAMKFELKHIMCAEVEKFDKLLEIYLGFDYQRGRTYI